MYALCKYNIVGEPGCPIVVSDDLCSIQELCLSYFQEQAYEEYYIGAQEFNIPEEQLDYLDTSYCDYCVKEVPFIGCEVISKNENTN